MRFYLGTHQPGWLNGTVGHAPLFVSDTRLRSYKSLPVARAPWALDSGGFTELSLYGKWTQAPADYARRVARYADEIGCLEWAAPQDWMCEPHMLQQTGLTIEEHQARTVRSVVELREMLGSDLIVPVLQGWRLDDYLRHADQYAASGVDLWGSRVVGVGSVCRRQASREGVALVLGIIDAMPGLPVHLFGFKTTGLCALAAAGALSQIASSDSLAWSSYARSPRTRVRLPGCSHINCANCHIWAMQWRDLLLESMAWHSEIAEEGAHHA